MGNCATTQRWGGIAFLLVIPGLLFAGNASGKGSALFLGAGEALSADTSRRATTIRERRVAVDHQAIAGAGHPSGADAVGLNLFADTELTAVKVKFERRDSDHFIWSGKIEGDPLSMVVLVGSSGLVHGTIFAHGKYYALRGGNAASQELEEIDQAAFPPEGCEQARQGDPALATPAPQAAPDLSADTGSVIDVLVVYTPAARVAEGGAAAIRNLATLAVAQTNETYANSGITTRLALAHTQEIAYGETGNWDLDLSRLRGTSDGYMDSVHALRDTYHADVVVLLVDNHALCGMAYLMGTVSPSFASSAFALVDTSCATSNLTFGHEIGHIQGARHDWYVDATDNSPFTYNHGTTDLVSRQRSMMAYNDKCADSLAAPDNFCTRVPYWSNPSVVYPVNPDFPDPTPNPTGSATENNRLTLNQTASTVANFRQNGGLPITGDFDGDGKADYGHYLPSSGSWEIKLSAGGVRTETFGYTGTIPLVGDFDGDGKADFGCYDPAGLVSGGVQVAPPGSWYIMQSTAGFRTETFGYTGTLPIVGDFDGDGKADFGCYDPAGLIAGGVQLAPPGSWYIMQSTAGFRTETFGYAGTLPIVGDFDGDGKADFGCYDPAGLVAGGVQLAPPGSWYIMQSTAHFRTETFGYAGTLPIVGDFDGDGKADFGCYDPAGLVAGGVQVAQPGSWYIMQSTALFRTETFGYAGTLPIVGDFDGDGKADFGCYAPSGNNWFLMRSAAGFFTDIF